MMIAQRVISYVILIVHVQAERFHSFLETASWHLLVSSGHSWRTIAGLVESRLQNAEFTSLTNSEMRARLIR